MAVMKASQKKRNSDGGLYKKNGGQDKGLPGTSENQNLCTWEKWRPWIWRPDQVKTDALAEYQEVPKKEAAVVETIGAAEDWSGPWATETRWKVGIKTVL